MSTETADPTRRSRAVRHDYSTALADEQIFLARQNITLGLLAAAIAVTFVCGSSHPVVSYVLGAVLAVTAICRAAVELIRWKDDK